MTDHGYKVLLCVTILIGWMTIVCLGHEISQHPKEIKPTMQSHLYFFHQVSISPHMIRVQINEHTQLWKIDEDTFTIGDIGGDYIDDNGFSIGSWVRIPITELRGHRQLMENDMQVESLMIRKGINLKKETKK